MSYPGGKGNSYQKIINLIPPHTVYIEPFAGGASVALNKRPASQNILLDRDYRAIKTVLEAITKNSDDGSETWYCVQADALKFLQGYRIRGNEFIYCDPPYLLSTRSQQRPIYNHEFALEAEHHKLLCLLKRLNCYVMVSGYWSELYACELSDWSVTSFETVTRGGTMATEYLWFNYPEPEQLHDYSFLGDNFRERERIKRKIKRWANRLKRLPTLERQAILSALSELGYLP